MAITSLSSTDNFKTWFGKTNELITQVNLQSLQGVTGVSGANGIGVSYENGLNMVYIKNTIPNSITFSNNVTIQGNASVAGTLSVGSINVNKTILSYTPKKSGLTAGNVVRIDSVLGLTFAKADTADNAEIFGIIVGEDSSTNSNLVAVSGRIDNTSFSNTIRNALGIVGATLAYGAAYFLSPTVAGGITSIEPNTYGQVSRPVLLGITGEEGLILQYRGIIIEGISAGITAELDNKIILQVDTNVATWGVANETPSLGDPVYYFGEFDSTGDMPTDLKAASATMKIRGASNNNTIANTMVLNTASLLSARTYCIGAVSNIISVASGIYILEITTRGGNFSVDFSELDSDIYDKSGITGGIYKFNGTSKFAPTSDTKNTSWATLIRTGVGDNLRFVLDHTEFVDGTVVSSTPVVYTVSYGITSATENNLLVNGDFTVWQREFTDIIGQTAFTSPYFVPICDRWFLNTHGCSAFSVNVSKNEFENTQTEVLGAPTYWINYQNDAYTLRTSGNLAQRLKLQNIQRGARLLQGQTATMSFYAKSGVTGATIDAFYNRYKNSYAGVTGLTAAIEDRTVINGSNGITLTADWKEYVVTFVPDTGITLDSGEEGWFGVGFEFPTLNSYDIAQVRLNIGESSVKPVYKELEKQLQECRRYYQSSYSYGIYGGSDQDNNKNESILDLGNLNTIKEYEIKFPVKMVNTPKELRFYSPVSGVCGEAFNVSAKISSSDAGNDMRNSSSTVINVPWSVANPFRTAQISNNIVVSGTKPEGFYVTINSGAYSLDRIKLHWIANADIDKTII